MKQNIYIAILGLGLASCSMETPFQGPEENSYGEFSKGALNLDVKLDDNIKVRTTATRADADIINDFEINFVNTATNQIAQSYTYKNMPEVVSLAAGSYKIEAVYGEDLEAEWENPHFKGTSEAFTIEANKVNTSLNPVVCQLQNVMVSVVFDQALINRVTKGEPEVTVRVNNSKTLTYKLEHSNNRIVGYFKHSEACTLEATFHGWIDDVELNEIKALNGIEPGNHYRLNFALHNYDANEKGEIDPDVLVDASVSVKEVSSNVDMEEDKPLDDVTWPTEDPLPGEDPTPDNPDEDEPGIDQPGSNDADGLSITADYSICASDFSLTGDNYVNEQSKVALKIHSDKGLTEFKVKINIVSVDMTSMGVPGNTMDLVNPADSYIDFAKNAGLMGEDKKDSLAGEKDLTFDISGFMELLCIYEGRHTFDLHIADEDGSKDITLVLIVEK